MGKRRNEFQRPKSEPKRTVESTFGIRVFEDHLAWRWTILLMILAYVLVVSIRFGWLIHAQDVPSFWWQEKPIYNNNDSVFFACTLQKALEGAHQTNNQVPDVMQHGIITALPYVLIKTLGISIDTTILLMGPFVSGLLVVPLILIGRLYSSVTWGFMAAVLGGAAHSYFNRTHVGYFDTDMYAVTVPTLAFYFLLVAARRDSLWAALLGGLTLFLYPFFYGPGVPILCSLAAAFLLYQFGAWLAGYLGWSNQPKPFPWDSVLLVSLAVSLSPLSRGWDVRDHSLWWVLALAAIGAAMLLAMLVATHLSEKPLLRGLVLAPFSIACVVIFMVTAIIFAWPTVQRVGNRTLSALSSPQAPDDAPSVKSPANGPSKRLQFKDVLSAIRETRGIELDVVAKRIVGSVPGAIAAVVGYVLLCIAYREFLISLPLVAIGIVSFWFGLRFTIYAVPIAALAATFGALLVARFINNSRDFAIVAVFSYSLGCLPIGFYFYRSYPSSIFIVFLILSLIFLALVIARLISDSTKFTVPLAVVLVAALLYPNIEHAWIYHKAVRTVLTEPGVRALDELGEAADENDFVITWWDYGSSVWAYAGCQTLNSPASNQAPDNFLLSKILTTDSQQQAANLSREAVENYVAKGQDELVDGKPPYRSAVQRILRDGKPDAVDPNEYLERAAADDFEVSTKTRDVYLFMPLEMIPIMPAIYSFSNRDLSTGREGPNPQFSGTRRFGQRGDILTVGPLRIDLKKRTAALQRGQRLQRFPLASILEVRHNDDRPPRIHRHQFDPQGDMHVVLLNANGQPIPLIMNTRMLNSAAVQMYIFENYDKDLFELVSRTASAKVYRVKK